MRNARLIVITVILILLATTASQALILHEDNTYWYKDGNNVATILNPDQTWLNTMVPTDRLLVKIEETVYDRPESLEILQGNRDVNAPTGFLYAYSISNLGIGVANNPADKGITQFSVSWAVQPTYVTTNKDQMRPEWVVDDTSVTKPAWKWTSTVDRGITKGMTLGGFWAISNISEDGECRAEVYSDPFGGAPWMGKTTGPCPEPGSIVSLFAGIAGLGLTVKLRRKK